MKNTFRILKWSALWLYFLSFPLILTAQDVVIDSILLGNDGGRCDTVFKAKSIGATLNLQHFQPYSNGLLGIATTPDSLFFMDFSFSGELRRSRSYKPHSSRSALIQQLAINNDLAYISGLLSGSAPTYLGVLMKFNIQSFELEWYSQGNDRGVIWWQIFPEDDQIIAIGTSHNTGQEIIITKFDPANGQRISDVTGYDQLDSESLYRTRKVGNKYYSVGRISTDRRGSSGMRHAQLIWDADFNLEQAKAYMRFGVDVSRLYPYAMTVDEAFIYSISSGMYEGTSNISQSVYLQITDLVGNPTETKEIRVANGTTLATQAFYADSTLYVTGTRNSQRESFVLAFDRYSFAPLFAHSFDRYSTQANFGCQVIESPQGLKLAVSELAPDNSSVISVFPLSRAGIEPSTNCASIQSFTFQILDLPNRSLDIPLTITSRSESSQIISLDPSDPILEKSVCTINCEACTSTEVWGRLILCTGETYTVSNGQSITQAGEYDFTLPSVSGCDSIIHLNVLVESNTTFPYETSLCEGSSVTVFGQTYYQGGNYTPVLSGTSCDVQVDLSIEAFPSYNLLSPLPSCDNQPVRYNNNNFFPGDTISQTLQTTEGCDSIIQSPIIPSTSFSESTQAVICSGGSINFEGTTYDQPGTYSANYQTSQGCDSTLYLELSVVAELFTDANYTICEGDTLLLEGQTILRDTSWQNFASSYAGCDSTHTINVTRQLNPTLTVLTEIGSCNGDSTGMLVVSATGASMTTILWSTGTTGDTVAQLPAGDYYALVTDREGCEAEVELEIQVEDPVTISYQMLPPSCLGDENGSINLVPPDSILYSEVSDSSNVTHTYADLASGWYDVSFVDLSGCALDTMIYVDEGQDPPAIFHETPITLQLGDSVKLLPFYDPSHDILWQDSTGLITCDSCPNPWVRPLSTIELAIEVTDSAGCTSIAPLLLQVTPGPRLGVPTAFSPNGDGVNDRWQPNLPANVEGIDEILIFNRWGNLIFKQVGISRSDPTFGWDGYYRSKLMNPEVFVYLINYRLIDGSTSYVAGDLTLIR